MTCLHSCIHNDPILCKWTFVLYTLTALGDQPQALPDADLFFFLPLGCEIYFNAIISMEFLKLFKKKTFYKSGELEGN